MVWRLGIHRPYAAKDFQYGVDVTASNNYYSQADGRYTGERFANGRFYVRASKLQAGQANVQTMLDVRDLDGQRLASISRSLTLSQKTGALAGETSGGKPVYLFAPRYIHKAQDFMGTYALYNEPARMHFVGKDMLYGVTVYHYKAEYLHGSTPIQNAIPTPNIPAGLKVVYHPNVQLWIEPTSGWLIKIADDTTVDLADAHSGKTIAPYNHFYAHYTDATVRQQAAYAAELRYQLRFARYTAPACVLLLLLSIPTIWYMRRIHSAKLTVRVLAVVILAGNVITLLGWIFSSRQFISGFAGGVGINPLAFNEFAVFLLGLASVYRRQSRLVGVVSGMFVAAAGFVALLGCLHIIGFRLDEVLWKGTLQNLETTLPSDLSVHDAGMFVLLGLALVGIAHRRTVFMLRAVSFTASSVLIFSGAALLIDFLQLDHQVSLGYLAPLSPIMSVMLVAAAYLLLQVVETFGPIARVKRFAMLRQLIWPTIVSLPLIVVALVVQFRHNTMASHAQTLFMVQAESIEAQLGTQVDVYKATLLGTQALYAASHSVEPDEWHTFVSNYTHNSFTEGMEAVGYAPIVRANDVAVYSSSVRQYASSFTIFPSTSNTTLIPVQYIEPRTANVQKLLGYDLSSNQLLNGALNQAEQTGKAAISDKLRTDELPGISQKGDTNFVVVQPVYTNGMPTDTVARRHAAIQGYVFAVISVQNLIKSVSMPTGAQLDFQIYDGYQADPEELLYDTHQAHPEEGTSLQETNNVYALDHPWTIAFEAKPDFEAHELTGQNVNSALVVFSVVYLLGIGAVYVALVYRRRYTSARKHQKALHSGGQNGTII